MRAQTQNAMRPRTRANSSHASAAQQQRVADRRRGRSWRWGRAPSSGRADNLQQGEERIERQQPLVRRPSCSGFQITGVTKNVICTHAADDRRDVAEPRAQRAEQQAQRERVDQPEREARAARAGRRCRATVQKIANTTTITTRLCASTSRLRSTIRAAYSENGMRIERIMPSIAVKASRHRRIQRADEAPQHQRQREERQVLVQVHVEQGRVEDAHRPDHRRGREREPERAEHGAAIAQPDVEPRQRPAQPPLPIAARRSRSAMRCRAASVGSGVRSRVSLLRRVACSARLMVPGAIADRAAPGNRGRAALLRSPDFRGCR